MHIAWILYFASLGGSASSVLMMSRSRAHCAADTSCNIDCDGNDSCQRDVTCDSQNGDCLVACGGDNACDVVACVANQGTCDINCNGEDSCLGGTDCDSDQLVGDCRLDAE